MNKQHILDEIVRTAKENGGLPLGKGRFFKETGIKDSDWYGKYWSRWGDAVEEAGFSPNQLNAAHPEEHLILKYAGLTRRLGRLPVSGELRLECRSDPSFPSHSTFSNRFASKSQLVSKVLEYCRSRSELTDVAKICEQAPFTDDEPAPGEKIEPDEIGFVYLLKSGRNYKIGRSNAVGRRERELAIQLPDAAKTVHSIRTDDPVGIEEYWHKRFAGKRKNGEWFELDGADVGAFRRRKFM